jgi:hypothetical protein
MNEWTVDAAPAAVWNYLHYIAYDCSVYRVSRELLVGTADILEFFSTTSTITDVI